MWKIYYGDGTAFSSLQGSYLDAPAWDVQVIVMDDRHHGRRTQCRNDYYIFRDERWWGVDQGGLLDYLVQLGLVRWRKNKMWLQVEAGKWKPTNTFQVMLFCAERGLAKFGRTVDIDTFSDLFCRAQSDPDFHRRVAWYRDEYRMDCPEVI